MAFFEVQLWLPFRRPSLAEKSGVGLHHLFYYRLFGRPCCVRANFGWKLWASRDKVAQYVGIEFNPVKGFEF